MRRHHVITVLAATLLASLAQSLPAEKPKLPRCEGGKRRDANPYGSVLPGASKPAVTAPATAGKPVALLTAPRGSHVMTRLRHFPSC